MIVTVEEEIPFFFQRFESYVLRDRSFGRYKRKSRYFAIGMKKQIDNFKREIHKFRLAVVRRMRTIRQKGEQRSSRRRGISGEMFVVLLRGSF